MKHLKLWLLSLVLLTLTACGTPTPSIPDITPPAPTVTAPDTTTPDVTVDGNLEVHFIDVGQADSILILCDDQSMLIDGGNVDDSSLIVSYLTSEGIDTLNHVVCTHAHEDHVGGLAGALSKFTAQNVYSPVTQYDTRAFENFVKYTKAQGLSLTVPSVGEQWNVGDAVVTVLGPQKEYDDTNNTSIVLRLDYGDTSFLFTGDAEDEPEKDMMNAGMDLEVTVLKVGHHGSSSSTGYQFLREVNPQYAVIQCGVDNKYGHPHDEVLSRLRDADVPLYRNDLQGHIIATSDGKTVSFQTVKGSDVVTNPTAPTPEYEGGYIGNVNSQVFHTDACGSLPAEHNQIAFSTREEAVDAGYTPCGRCKP